MGFKMSIRQNKLIILEKINQETAPISLPELLSKLGSEFKERSVRRWLNELIEEGLAQKSGQKKGTKYFAKEAKVEQLSGDVSNCFNSSSLKIIEIIKKPLFERKPVSYSENWFDSYRPNIDYYLSTSIRKQLHQAGKRASVHDPAGTYAHQIFNRLLIDLTYNSSRLEGNTYSRLDTERLLLHGDTPAGKMDEEKIMILNHKEAIRYLVDNAHKLEISRNVICTLHYLLSDGLVEHFDSGKVRKHGVRIGGSVYMPFEDPKHLELQLEKIINKASLIQEPFEQSAFLLMHISYLQAFADVNKRTARLAANIPLIKNNLVPLAFNDVSIDDYVSAMIAVYELQETGPLVDLYFYSYMRTCLAYDSTVTALGFDEIRVRYRQQRRKIVRDIILNNKVQEQLDQYIQIEATRQIPESDRKSFIEDIQEDLKEIDESYLAGLGIDSGQLAKWLKSCKSVG